MSLKLDIELLSHSVASYGTAKWEWVPTAFITVYIDLSLARRTLLLKVETIFSIQLLFHRLFSDCKAVHCVLSQKVVES